MEKILTALIVLAGFLILIKFALKHFDFYSTYFIIAFSSIILPITWVLFENKIKSHTVIGVLAVTTFLLPISVVWLSLKNIINNKNGIPKIVTIILCIIYFIQFLIYILMFSVASFSMIG